MKPGNSGELKADSLERIAYIMVTYNSASRVADCLSAIRNQRLVSAQVIVVDNDSHDLTAEIVTKSQPDATLIRNTQNLGYGAAVNSGAAAAHSEYLVILNPDVTLHPDWSARILQTMKARPQCGAAEGRIFLAREPDVLNCDGSHINFLGFGCMKGYGRRAPARDQVTGVSYPSGAAFMARRAAFLQVGGFDATYFLYYEDADLGLRLHADGWEVLNVPSAICYHDYNPSLRPEKVYWLERNRWKTLARNLDKGYFLLCAPLLVLFEIATTAYLAKIGLLREKTRASLDFLHEALRLRRKANHGKDTAQHSAEIIMWLTDDFPEILPQKGMLPKLARSVQRSYYNAFLRSRVESLRAAAVGSYPQASEGLMDEDTT